MLNTNFDLKTFNEMKDFFGFGYDELGEIVNLKSGTVRNQTSPYSNKLSTWMRGMTFMWNYTKSLRKELEQTEASHTAMINKVKELKAELKMKDQQLQKEKSI